MKLTESFEGRDDKLQCRSATFSPAGAGALAGAVGGGGVKGASRADAGSAGVAPAALGDAAASAAIGGVQERALPVAKVSERFGRNAEKPADQDVAKRVFYFSEGKTALYYHHGEGRLSCGCLVFHKDGQAQAVQV